MVSIMRMIRDDAFEKMNHALTLVRMARASQSPQMIAQHLDGIERILDLCVGSMRTPPTGEPDA